MQRVFTSEEYWEVIRPDILLLKNYPFEPKFENGKFWSVAAYDNKVINNGYKMKWHQIGSGNVQLRLPVALLDNVFLDSAYVKHNKNFERRKLAIFKTHIQLIQQGRYIECGVLT